MGYGYWIARFSTATVRASQGTFLELHSSNSALSARLVMQVYHIHCLSTLSSIAALCGLLEGCGSPSKALLFLGPKTSLCTS